MAVPRRGAEWSDRARWAEDQGFTTLLLPDTLNTASPFPALAAAAAVTSTLRLRPWVLSAPLRHPAAVVREAAALQLLSDGRLEVGIGIGRPYGESEAERLGMSWGSPGERRTLLREVVQAVRGSVDPAPPIAVTAAGPKMLAEAASFADRIGLALGPHATLDDLVRTAEQVRSVRAVPLTRQLVGIGDAVVGWPPAGQSVDPTTAIGILPADPGAAEAVLQEGLDRLGIDEVVVPSDLADAFLPIIRRLD
jgi:alkanesulfonate monooxygenase SsuD/methylene tetrahydromethanopterin reductase-like flavin-dependent oxidoreductase (luciferase family)